MSGSQPAGRTLLGFNQPFQPPKYPAQQASSPTPAPASASASASATTAPAPQQSAQEPTTSSATPSRKSPPEIPIYPTAPSEALDAKDVITASSSTSDATESQQQQQQQSQPDNSALLGNDEPTASAAEPLLTPAPHRPSSVASGSQVDQKSSVSQDQEEREEEASGSLKEQTSSSHLPKPSGGRSTRSTSNASLSGSPAARASRRGYIDDSESSGYAQNAPRDLLAQHFRKGSEGGARAASPIMEDSTDEYRLPPGLAPASDSPSMRSRRGVLLTSSNSALSGRRNRRRGSGSVGGDSASAAGTGDDQSSVGPGVNLASASPAVSQPASAVGTFEDASADQNDLLDKEDDDDDDGSVVFQAGSALSHGSDPSDGAESGKVGGSQVPAHQSLISEPDHEDQHEDDEDDEDEDGESELETSHDSSSPASPTNRDTLHAPLFASFQNQRASAVRSPSASFSSVPPPIPARRARQTGPQSPPPPRGVHPEPTASRDSALLSQEESDRRQALEATRKREDADRAQWEKRILEADWEELEVARFLNQFGRHVHAVKGTQLLDSASFSQPAFPTRYDWTTYSEDGTTPRFNAFGYSIAWTTAFLSYISPSRMIDLQRESLPEDEEEFAASADVTLEEFRWEALKATSERLYLSAMPLYESLSSKLRHVYRWESKLHTLAYMVTYTFLWWRGLLLSSLIFGIIMLVLSLKTFPPKPDALREIIGRQKRREQEARRPSPLLRKPESIHETSAAATGASIPEVTETVLPRSKYSLAVEATRKYGMQTSIIGGALADGHERAKNFALWRSPRATWRLLFWLSIAFFISLPLKPIHLMRFPGAAMGIVFFIIAPIAEYKPHWIGLEWSNPLDWIFAGVPNDAQYSMEILRGRAAQGKPLLSDTSLLLRPDIPPMSVEEQMREASSAANNAPASANGGIDWTRWADAVMKGKSMAISGSELLSGSRALNLPRLPVQEITASTSTSSALLANLTKGLNRGIKAIEDHRNSKDNASLVRNRAGSDTKASAEETEQASSYSDADQDGTYWCVYGGVCGHLVVTPKSIFFRSLFARRPRGRRGQLTSASKTSLNSEGGSSSTGHSTIDDQPLLDAETGALTIPESSLSDPSLQPKVKILLEIPLERIVGLKKVTNKTPSVLKEASNWTSMGKKLNQIIKGEGGLEVTLERKRRRRNMSVDSMKSTDTELDDTALLFAQMRKRDEAFNRLLALTPRQWEKAY
ncbi:unnamed protein product [Sympodiomycopsis kandeliae]